MRTSEDTPSRGQKWIVAKYRSLLTGACLVQFMPTSTRTLSGIVRIPCSMAHIPTATGDAVWHCGSRLTSEKPIFSPYDFFTNIQRISAAPSKSGIHTPSTQHRDRQFKQVKDKIKTCFFSKLFSSVESCISLADLTSMQCKQCIALYCKGSKKTTIIQLTKHFHIE